MIRILLFSMLLFSTWLDIQKRQVSIILLIIYAILGIVLYIFYEYISVLSLAGGIAVGIVMLMVSRLTKGGIGAGDGGVLCVTGIYLGFYKNIELFFLALVLAAFWSMMLVLLKRAGGKTQIPFVPFLTAAYAGLLFM